MTPKVEVMVKREEFLPTAGERDQPFRPKFRAFLAKLFAALIAAALLVTLAAYLDSGFWSPVLAGAGIAILVGIGMWTTVTHGEFVRRAGPLPVLKDRQRR